MATKLNDEQKLFVKALNNNVLVSASAGSGKTTTMIEKLKKLIIEDKVPVEKLLVVTFTEAAASEMKQKLYLKLQAEIANLDLSEQETNYFYEQLFQIATADIGTLHSVCRKIVSKYFYEVNVEPSFAILTNEEYLNLFNQAIEKTFANYIESSDEEFYVLYESFNDKRSNLKLKNIVTTIYNFLSEKSDPDKFINFCLSDCLNPNLNNNICATYVFNYFKASVKKFIQEIKSYKTIIEHEKLSNYLTDLLNKVSEINNTETFTEFVVAVNNFKAPTLYNPKQPELLNVFENLKTSVEGFKISVIGKAKKIITAANTENFEQLTTNLKVYYQKLFEVVNRVREVYSKLKHDIGKLDFSDLQILALKILENQTIALELKNNYAYIFVDEYQDINQIQEDILLKLSNSKNLNMIGDVKQSIYAFRQCMPEIFLSKYNSYLGKLNEELILLNKNYRCSKEVVNFVNHCFNTLITSDTIGINYKTDAQLICGSGNSGAVEIRIVNTSESETEQSESEAEPQDENVVEFEKEEAEALEVAKIISEVYGKEYYDDATQQNKKLDYKDIAILVRDAKGFAQTLYNTLKAHQIPVSTTIKTSLFNTIEIKPLYSLLKLANNSSLEVDICNVLLSQFVGLSINDLIEIKQFDVNDSFYNNLLNYTLSGKNVDIVDKLNKYNAILSDFKYRLNYSSIMESVNHVVIKHDIINHYLSMPNGEEMVENIRQFIMLLGNAGFNFHLKKCLQFLDSLSKKDDFLISVESGENSVKILTMHKSKGLEYPCVILSGLGKQFNKGVYSSDVILTNKLGMGLNYRNIESRNEIETLQKNANKLFQLNSELEEQIRLLYVALTRARNYLFLTGTYNLKNFLPKQNKHIFASTNFLDLIFKSFVGHEKFGFVNFKESFQFKINETEVECKIKNISSVMLEAVNVNNQVLISTPSKTVVDSLINNFEKVKLTTTEKLATKNSVTGLMREDDYVNENELSLQVGFNEDQKNNLSLKIGNAYHKIMQQLSYTETKQEIETLISNLLFKGEIDADAKPFIKADKIYKAKENVKSLLTPETIILKEQQFLFKTPYSQIVETSSNNQEILIQGVIDLILINGAEATVIDFKTNKTKDVAKLINSYSLQLEVYKRAVEKGLHVKVTSSKLYLFESATFIEIV